MIALKQGTSYSILAPESIFIDYEVIMQTESRKEEGTTTFIGNAMSTEGNQYYIISTFNACIEIISNEPPTIHQVWK